MLVETEIQNIISSSSSLGFGREISQISLKLSCILILKLKSSSLVIFTSILCIAKVLMRETDYIQVHKMDLINLLNCVVYCICCVETRIKARIVQGPHTG